MNIIMVLLTAVLRGEEVVVPLLIPVRSALPLGVWEHWEDRDTQLR